MLLIVRPSGAVAYGAARHLLERMKEPFGYELLPDDEQLDVPPAVPEAAEACRKAVEKAIAQRVDVFKEVFGNGAAPGGGRLAGGGRRGTAGTAGAANGPGNSPFDDMGDSLLGGSKHGGQQLASGSDGGASNQPGGTGRQPVGPGTQPGGTNTQPSGTGAKPGGIDTQPGGIETQPGGNGTQPVAGTQTGGTGTQLGGSGTQPGMDGINAASGIAQAAGVPAGTGPGLNGAPNGPNTGPLLSGSAQTGATASGDQGTRSGNSDNRAGSALVSDAGPGGLGQMPGGQGAASTPGLGNQGLAAGGHRSFADDGRQWWGPAIGSKLTRIPSFRKATELEAELRRASQRRAVLRVWAFPRRQCRLGTRSLAVLFQVVKHPA